MKQMQTDQKFEPEEIAQMNANINKLMAEAIKMTTESLKLQAETGKLEAEKLKLSRERTLYPMVAFAGFLAAVGGAAGAAVAVWFKF
jgi:hypothetical protein